MLITLNQLKTSLRAVKEYINKVIGDSIPTDVSELTNDAGYITIEDVPEAVTIDDKLNDDSTNPIQNKVVTTATNHLQTYLRLAFEVTEEQPTKLDDLFKYSYILYDNYLYMFRSSIYDESTNTSAGYCTPDIESGISYDRVRKRWIYHIRGGNYQTLASSDLSKIVGYTFDVPSTSDIPTTAADVGALPSSTTISIGGTITFGTGANVNTATFSSNKSISAMGNAARSGVSIIFWDSANSRMYKLADMQHIADSGDIFTFINISSNVVHKIVTGTLDTYNSTSKTFTGTYSQIELSTFSGSYNDLSDKPTIPTQEIYVGSGTPAGYMLYIDPDSAMSSGEGVSF